MLDSTSIQELNDVPTHLVVIGGGYVGLEFAQLFHRLDSQVTIIQSRPQLVPREDREIAHMLQEILEADGLSIHANTRPMRISPSHRGFALSIYTDNSGDQTIEGTHILSAVGRIPNTDNLKPEAAGIDSDSKGYILTNE